MAETIPSDILFLALIDDPEGFRVLLQNKELFVYALHADAVFYRRYSDLSGLNVGSPVQSPARTGKQTGLIFRVHDSALVSSLSLPDTVPLSHYALCFDDDDRIDIVCRGEAHVRAAHSRFSESDR